MRYELHVSPNYVPLSSLPLKVGGHHSCPPDPTPMESAVAIFSVSRSNISVCVYFCIHFMFCLSVRPSVCLDVCLFVCLSVVCCCSFGKNSGKVLTQYFAYGRLSWQDN